MVNNNHNNHNNNSSIRVQQILPSLRVGVYYYPWYGPNFHGRSGYPRRELTPPQYPVLGEYDDRQAHVIAQHVQWSQQSGIQIWITSWWGPHDPTDQTLLQTILPYLQETNNHNNTTTTTSPIQMAVFYETVGRIKKQTTEDGFMYDFSNIQSDIRYIARQYFCHTSIYYRIRGRPVLFVYVTRALDQDDVLGTVIGIMRKAAKEEGYDNLYIVGDQVWSDPPNDPKQYQPFQLLDAVTNYDVYGNLRNQGDVYARQDAVDRYQARQMAWFQATRDSGKPCAFIPSITPGFTKIMGGEFMPLSRQLDDSAPQGSLFQALLQNSFQNADECADHLVMITSWNEWHEDTQIEPVDPADGNTNQPWNVTNGITYHAYGTLYLDILKQEICEYCTGSSSSSLQPDTGGCFSCLQPTLELEMGVCSNSGCGTLSLGGVPCILFLLVGILSVLRTIAY